LAASNASDASDASVKTMHPRFPLYGWDRNKGYGSAMHMRAIIERGPCEEHRRSFAPIKGMLSSSTSVHLAVLG
jgi:ribonuclease HII